MPFRKRPLRFSEGKPSILASRTNFINENTLPGRESVIREIRRVYRIFLSLTSFLTPLSLLLYQGTRSFPSLLSPIRPNTRPGDACELLFPGGSPIYRL